MTEREITSFDLRLENVRRHRIMNYQERRVIADLILEGYIESDNIRPLVQALALLDKVDLVLINLEEMTQLVLEQAREEKVITLISQSKFLKRRCKYRKIT